MSDVVDPIEEDYVALDALRNGVVGKCPVCEATLSPPEYRYDGDGTRYLDGPGNYWCPACGWEPPDPDFEERLSSRRRRES